jgi:predicted amidophosphoribosyltransferase
MVHPVLSIMKYMTKTCGKCGHSSLDDLAQFCNRCGAAVPKEIKPAFPVCPGCGSVVSDELAQFCNRCGTKITPVPVVCSTCGSPALDNQSLFCTRCGTTFEKRPVFHITTCPSCGAPDTKGQSVYCNRCGAPLNRQDPGSDHLPHQAPVIVTQRKPAGRLPPVTVPDTDWEPWNDVPYPGPLAPSRPAAPEHDAQIAVPQKRYAHLPLVAEDMRKKGDPALRQREPESPHLSPKKKAATKKKGILGLLKK